ncbi:oxidoreductase C-terminal domain-containing protein [Rhodococcoides fascians]|uniref:oxidoreductase C-terminal domain-containing protein n=1 Tax=Rhodococcoides fascians TaxID=1828 RepID=UPI0005630B50
MAREKLRIDADVVVVHCNVKLQLAGLSAVFGELIVRGGKQSFSAAYPVMDTLALDTIKLPRDVAAAKRLNQTKAHVDRYQVSDPSIPTKDAVTVQVGAAAR